MSSYSELMTYLDIQQIARKIREESGMYIRLNSKRSILIKYITDNEVSKDGIRFYEMTDNMTMQRYIKKLSKNTILIFSISNK